MNINNKPQRWKLYLFNTETGERQRSLIKGAEMLSKYEAKQLEKRTRGQCTPPWELRAEPWKNNMNTKNTTPSNESMLEREKIGAITAMARNQKATAPETPQHPSYFAPGTRVKDKYNVHGEKTVRECYWQNYDGGSTSDYTVTFNEGGWNKGSNLIQLTSGKAELPQWKLKYDDENELLLDADYNEVASGVGKNTGELIVRSVNSAEAQNTRRDSNGRTVTSADSWSKRTKLMTTHQFNQSVTREIQRIMREAEEKRKAEEEWPSVEIQLKYWKEKENDSRTS